MMREQPAETYRLLKSTFQLLVKLMGGGLGAEGFTRVDQPQLSRYGSTAPDNDRTFAPIDVVLDLELAAREPVVTRMLARLQGYLLVKAPDPEACETLLHRITMRALQEVSEAFAELAKAQADDNAISLQEAELVGRQIDDALEVLAALKVQVASNARAEGSRS